jgi:cyanophycin synthetase
MHPTSPPPSTTPFIQPLGRDTVQGLLPGFVQPAVRLQLQLLPLAPACRDLVARLAAAVGNRLIPMPEGMAPTLADRLSRDPSATEQLAPVWPLVESLNHLLVRLQEVAGLPVARGLRCEAIAPAGSGPAGPRVLLSISSLSPPAVDKALAWIVPNLNALANGLGMALDGLSGLLTELERHAPGGTNNRQLIKAAYRYGVPVQALPGRCFQYGWGSRARWMDSTFTDATSSISASLARNKVRANDLLRRAGLPVPAQVVVGNLQQTIEAARKIGYPVVVKPSNLDGGKGVSAGLEDEAALRLAFARAQAHSKSLILEKHIEGNDYRLGIVHGELGWATFREPAGVRGDGVSSIGQLIDIANRDPNRGTQPWSNMRPLVVNAEATELLAAQRLDLFSVPAPGHFVRLRRSANISSGGTPTSMMGKVHPDNIALAIRAAAVFRLDFAGIDLITPDVTRSWLEVGGAICEINGQPQFSVMGPQAPRLAIQGLFKGDGRIPIVVILADRPVDELLQAAAQDPGEHALTLGYSTGSGLFIGEHMVRRGRASAFDDTQALLLNRQVDAVAIVTDGKEWLRTGLPFDRFDLLVATGQVSRRVWETLAPQCNDGLSKIGAPESRDTPALARKLGAYLRDCATRHLSARLAPPAMP